MNINKILKVSTFAGKILLESGAETYRVEETICRICSSFGIESPDSFVTPTGIMVSVSHDDHITSLVKRVKSRNVDLNKIDKVNALSRQLSYSPIYIDDFYKLLKEIDKGNEYPKALIIIFAAIAAGTFSILFDGDIKDFIAACIVGSCIKIFASTLQRFSINEFFINCIGGAIAAFLSITIYSLGLGNHVDKTIIGAIMLLVPGLAITNAIRDTIAGDYLSGLTKASEAFLIAIAIAIGTGSILSLWIHTLGGSI